MHNFSPHLHPALPAVTLDVNPDESNNDDISIIVNDELKSVDLKTKCIVGGIILFDLLDLPPPPKSVKKWTLRTRKYGMVGKLSRDERVRNGVFLNLL